MQAGRVLDTQDHGSSISVTVTGVGDERGESVTLYLERTNESRSVSPKDGVAWDGRFLYWTPKGAPFTDWPLYRIGYGRVLMPRLTRECA